MWRAESGQTGPPCSDLAISHLTFRSRRDSRRLSLFGARIHLGVNTLYATPPGGAGGVRILIRVTESSKLAGMIHPPGRPGMHLETADRRPD